MKKILLLIAFSVIALSVLGQVHSVTIKSAISLVDSAKITHYDSSVNATDTFYTWIKTSRNIGFTFPSYSPYVMGVGSGQRIDMIGYPLVKAGDTAFVVVEIADDTVLFANMRTSDTLMVIPKHKPVFPSITIATTKVVGNNLIITLPFTIGNTDSAVIVRQPWRDSLFKYKAGSQKTWTRRQDGTVVDTIKNLPNFDIYVQYTIDNQVFAKKVEVYHYIPLQTNKRPWIAKDKNVKGKTSTSITFSGSVEGYSASGTIFSKYGKNGTFTSTSSLVPITGIGTETYSMTLNGLNPNETYSIRTYVQTAFGIDSFTFTETTSGPSGKTFTVTTLSVNGDLGYIRMIWSRTGPSGVNLHISRAVFTDNTGTVTVDNTARTDVYTGNGTVADEEFHVPPGTYWVACWGNADDGQFVLPSQLIPVTVAQVVAGISGTEKLSFSVYPNPTTDYVNINTESFTGENIEIYDHIGKLVLMHSVSEAQTSIDVRDLVSGIYILKIKNHSSKFIKE